MAHGRGGRHAAVQRVRTLLHRRVARRGAVRVCVALGGACGHECGLQQRNAQAPARPPPAPLLCCVRPLCPDRDGPSFCLKELYDTRTSNRARISRNRKDAHRTPGSRVKNASTRRQDRASLSLSFNSSLPGEQHSRRARVPRGRASLPAASAVAAPSFGSCPP